MHTQQQAGQNATATMLPISPTATAVEKTDGWLTINISHNTLYHYESNATGCIQYLRKTPQNTNAQQIISWQLNTPTPCFLHQDGFGNVFNTLYMHAPHNTLTIMAQGQVRLNTNSLAITDNHIMPALFLKQTDLTLCTEPLRVFATQHLKQLDRYGLIDFSAALLDKMPYTQGSTASYTTAEESFLLAKGVCQDHTHVFLACVRQAGLMARYVSGYLYIEQTGHFASHAWAEVWLDNAWYCFDTSNQIFTPRQHIQLAIGRDYLDAAPVRGVRQGGGLETMDVTVQVGLS